MDRPRLNVRADRLGRAPSRQPARVAFPGGQRCESDQTPPTFVIANSLSELTGSTVIRAHGRDLAQPLIELWCLGVRSMLVEGGPTLLGSFLVQGCFDRITVFVRGGSRQTAVSHARLNLPGLPSGLGVESFGDGLIVGIVRPDRLPCAAVASREAK